MSSEQESLRNDLKILVVQGVQEAVGSLGDLLEELGFEDVRVASSGSKALELVEKGEVELVIADWNLRELSGLELLKAIRANEEYGLLPVVMTANEQESENLVEAICEGASNLLVVSNDRPRLLSALRLRLESVFKVDRFSRK